MPYQPKYPHYLHWKGHLVRVKQVGDNLFHSRRLCYTAEWSDGQWHAKTAQPLPGNEPRPDAYAKRLAAWRAWWPERPRRLTLAVLAERMEKNPFTISRYVSTHEPPELELGNLERLCSAYGYEPPTSD